MGGYPLTSLEAVSSLCVMQTLLSLYFRIAMTHCFKMICGRMVTNQLTSTLPSTLCYYEISALCVCERENDVCVWREISVFVFVYNCDSCIFVFCRQERWPVHTPSGFTSWTFHNPTGRWPTSRNSATHWRSFPARTNRRSSAVWTRSVCDINHSLQK